MQLVSCASLVAAQVTAGTIDLSDLSVFFVACCRSHVRCLYRTAATNEAPVPGLKALLDLCHTFVGRTQAFGCRSSLAMRNAVQLQCKAHLDHLHHNTLTNLTGSLHYLQSLLSYCVGCSGLDIAA